MKDNTYIPVHFTIALILGIIIGYYTKLPIRGIALFLVIMLGALIILYRRALKSYKLPWVFTVCTFLGFICVGALQIKLQKPEAIKRHYIHQSHSQSIKQLKVKERLRNTPTYQRYVVEVLKVGNQPAEGQMILLINKKALTEKLYRGDQMLTYLEIQNLNRIYNPGTFDYADYLEKQQIYGQLVLRDSTDWIKYTLKLSWLDRMSRFRDRLILKLEYYEMPDRDKNTLKALLLGQRQDMDKDQYKAFQEAGAAHLLAVSGLHVGIIMMMLNILLQPLLRLKRGKLTRLFIVVILLWLYAVFIGFSASIIRAVTMFTAVAIGMYLGRERRGFQSMVLSMWVLLLFNPWYIFDIGFQLSYMAVFSILSIQPLLENIWRPSYKILQYFWQLTTVTLAAQIGILPLCLFYFHQLPAMFLASSIVLIPCLGLVIGIGFLFLLGVVVDKVPIVILELNKLVYGAMNDLVYKLRDQDLYILKQVNLSWYQMLLMMVGITFVVKYFKNKNISFLYASLLLTIVLQVEFIYNRVEQGKDQSIIIFNQIKNTVIYQQKAKQFQISTRDSIRAVKVIDPFKRIQGLTAGTPHQDLKNVYQNQGELLLVVDQNLPYQQINFQPSRVLLSQSPQINLTRLIRRLRPKEIIADGSNYRSDLNRWQNTCRKLNVAFYATPIEGAYLWPSKP